MTKTWAVTICVPGFLAVQTESETALYLPLSLHTYRHTYRTFNFLTLKEQSWRVVTFERFDQSDEKTLPNQKKTMTNSNTFRELHQRAILETCDL